MPSRKRNGGRLLNEFLVGLAMLFLALGANLAVLHTATNSTEKSVLTDRALEIAQSGMEELIASPQEAVGERLTATFGAGKGGDFDATFSRSAWITVLKDRSPHLARATVMVEWNEGDHSIRLERYVRTN